MTKEKLEKAQAALANLEAHQRLLETIRQSGAIVIGPTHEVVAKSTEVIGYHQHTPGNYFTGGLLIGLKSDFFANPKIRELCHHFHEELTHILEEEVARLQTKFENL